MTDDFTDDFTEAQEAHTLRYQIRSYADTAITYGHVDRGWVNTSLARLGVEPITGSATYQLNIPASGVFGLTLVANSRADAAQRFKEYVATLATRGQIPISSGALYDVQFADQEPTFFSGPADPTEPADPTTISLGELKNGIRAMLKEGVTEQGWGLNYAIGALATMDLPPLPEATYRTVSVPVSGTANLKVLVFADDDDEVMQRAAARELNRTGRVSIKPDEMGIAYGPRSDDGDMGLTLTDD